ncbi:pentatricopeptide repeat-containing protein At3g29230-like [Malania oleifera]|uniref:pentatricopeptide repeat-containing protein At3g29230-like n=1 Tax=Malania oleifera TaxID=397392 RepID=UPI0025ADF534|nr:pentatricopeptide repeat-containing protein At3g29230-like [Malania oleifera]
MMLKATAAFITSKLQKLSTMKEVEQVQAVITKAGLHNHPTLIATLINFSSLFQSGSLTHAQMIFEETIMDNPFICNTLIRAYAKSVFPIRAIYLYNQMHRMNVEFDHFTFTFVLRACARVLFCVEEEVKFDGFGIGCKGAEIHCRVFKAGFDHDHFIRNSLVYMYSQCGFLSLARRVFDEMTKKTVASWNIMISAYDRVNDFISADSLLEAMPEKNVVSWNTLIARYIKFGDIEAARRVFQAMPKRDAVSWNSMIAGYVRIKDYTEALKLYGEMQTAQVEATEITLISVLGVCAETGELEKGRKVHEMLKQKGYKIEGYLGNALVDMYAKCGSMSEAWEIFNEMKMKHVSCWNAMIMGLAVNGYSKEALELFSAMEMRLDEVKPNKITFIGVLTACSHNGLVEEGRWFFSKMIKEYKITPDIKHYGCMVDLLSRWGFLNDANEVIKAMPFKANSVLWRTLLGASKVYCDVELAEESFQQLAKLEPLRDGDYVLLSNIYAEAERWNDVERVRAEMISSGVSKKPGSSHY